MRTYHGEGSAHALPTTKELQNLRRVVEVVGENQLGFETEDISAYSPHSSAVMATLLRNAMVFLIMLIGLWKSDGCLECVRNKF